MKKQIDITREQFIEKLIAEKVSSKPAKKPIAAPKPIKKSWVLNYKSYYSYTIAVYVIQNYCKAIATDLLISGRTTEFQSDYNVKENIISHGSITFIHNDKIHIVSMNASEYSVSVSSNVDITDFVDTVIYKIKHNNPLRNKHIQIISDLEDFKCVFKKSPTLTFKDLILDKNIKEDIYDNTIFQLKNLEDNNGLIFYGPPGTGKSLCCQAVINEAIKEGFSTCFITSALNYTAFNEFLESFLTPCIIVFEDIDSFCGQRDDPDNSNNNNLSDFLQFLSGLSEREEKFVVIATTNYIEQLDEAIRSRPTRFNRKIKFDYPNDFEIDQLIDLYFGTTKISKDDRALCYQSKFTGSHMREIYRTASLISKKNKVSLKEAFKQAVEIIKTNFSI